MKVYREHRSCLIKHDYPSRSELDDQHPKLYRTTMKDFIKTTDDHHLYHCNLCIKSVSFSSAAKYDYHYETLHAHRCCTCSFVCTSALMLDLHLCEQHDAYFQAMVQARREPMFRCLVEDCTERFLSPDDRIVHLIAAHGYPPNFPFASLLCRPRPKKQKKKKQKKKQKKKPDGTSSVEQDLSSSMSDLTVKVPSKIKFKRS